ncbi:hypothetical protein B0H66DRAFT_538575 [Apodospora peruviana]|uniref:Uncharacterized protein n=1 Tax=Apodospora peruviana TaxID=516989 RepID=A0AAE0HUM2_9PEZI|nr:hypothetical protein B0H66DRAFT_538575 [Apodospora peruviana]
MTPSLSFHRARALPNLVLPAAGPRLPKHIQTALIFSHPASSEQGNRFQAPSSSLAPSSTTENPSVQPTKTPDTLSLRKSPCQPACRLALTGTLWSSINLALKKQQTDRGRGRTRATKTVQPRRLILILSRLVRALLPYQPQPQYRRELPTPPAATMATMDLWTLLVLLIALVMAKVMIEIILDDLQLLFGIILGH